mmetsp:Transcript_7468/g.22119  ORF Transcript_7468/g.22119 Transcript_7468/m.22119 type:complete len:296 (-) Transcript_7468:32-919(-)
MGDAPEKERYDLPWWSSIVSGTAGGTCAVLIGYPFETLKVRLQTRATKHLFKDLFSGVTAPLATIVPQWAVMYGAYYASQRLLRSSEPLRDLGPVGRGAVSGGVCGFAVSVLAVPVDVIKINAQRMHCSAFETAKTLYAKRGPRFLYAGSLATFLHLTFSQAAFFAAYEAVLHRAPAKPKTGGMDYTPAVAGGISGVVEWTAFMPTDTVKTRVQAGAEGKSYLGAWREVWAAEGPRGFYRGYGVVVSRAVVVNAASFFAIEVTNDKMRSYLSSAIAPEPAAPLLAKALAEKATRN